MDAKQTSEKKDLKVGRVVSSGTQNTPQSVEIKVEKPLTAKVLSDALAGSAEERFEGERTIVLSMTAGQRPVVTFTGFWNGRFIRAALDSISKQYRLRRFKPSRPNR